MFYLTYYFVCLRARRQNVTMFTDRSFKYASPCLWNQLPDSFRQPRQSCLDLLTSSFTCQLISIIITTLIIHRSLLQSFMLGSKPTFSTNPSYLNTSSIPWTAFTITGLDRTYHASQFIFSSFS